MSIVYGIKLLDNKDNELGKWVGGSPMGKWSTKEVEDGFYIVGLYGDTTKSGMSP